MAPAPIDPNAALERLRGWRDEAGSLSYHIESDAQRAVTLADDMASVFRDLDEWLTSGGLWPQAWQPPITRDGDGHLPNAHAARHRLELVIDKAFRDDERADRLTNVQSDRAQPAVLRDHLVQLAARAVLDEIDAERQHAEAMMQHYLTQHVLGMRRNLGGR
jgi:hypothetical protein